MENDNFSRLSCRRRIHRHVSLLGHSGACCRDLQKGNVFDLWYWNNRRVCMGWVGLQQVGVSFFLIMWKGFPCSHYFGKLLPIWSKKCHTSSESLMALWAGASISSNKITLNDCFRPGAENSRLWPGWPLDGQYGRHSWASIELRVVIRWTSCSQTICQKDIIVFSIGCWVIMNSRRSKKPGEKRRTDVKWRTKHNVGVTIVILYALKPLFVCCNRIALHIMLIYAMNGLQENGCYVFFYDGK